MTHAATKPSQARQLEPPRFENGKALLIAGLRSDYTPESMNDLPAQWQRLVPHLGKIPGQIGRTAYGVSWCPENSPAISYLCGVEVSDFSSLPLEFTIVSIPAQRYAVFSHRGHVSRIRETIEAIGSKWLPESGQEPARRAGEAPDFFERYTEQFDARTGMGGMEIWIPVKC
jgi:AraC family transcriptional regulator